MVSISLKTGKVKERGFLFIKLSHFPAAVRQMREPSNDITYLTFFQLI